MRHKGVDREETRKKMGEAVGRGFRKFGYAGIGVDALAKGAGVTSGAFYAHFGSKNGAFEVALDNGLDEVIATVPEYQREHGEKWLEKFVDYYLSTAHRQNLECGCAMAALTVEVVRAEEVTRVIYEKKMCQIAELMVRGLAGDDAGQRAWGVLGILTGGLNMVRAMATTQSADDVTAAIRRAAMGAAGPVKRADFAA